MQVTDEMVKVARAEFVDRIRDLDRASEWTQDYLMEACQRAGYPRPDEAANFFVRAALEAVV